MPKRLAAKVSTEARGLRVEFTGVLDEDAEFASVEKEIGDANYVCLDVSGINHINSCGVRVWIRFMRSITRDVRRVELTNCSTDFVFQANVITDFVGRGRVLSVFAPFVCVECGKDHVQLIDTSDGTPPRTLDGTCPSCGGALEFDEFPESYFSFLTR